MGWLTVVVVVWWWCGVAVRLIVLAGLNTGSKSFDIYLFVFLLACWCWDCAHIALGGHCVCKNVK